MRTAKCKHCFMEFRNLKERERERERQVERHREREQDKQERTSEHIQLSLNKPRQTLSNKHERKLRQKQNTSRRRTLRQITS